MPSDVEMQDPPTIVADDKEAVEDAEGDRGHGEEIHGRDRFPVIHKKRMPALDRLGISGRSLHPRETLRSDTSKPSMSSSPWMRGAPQVAFSAIIRKIRPRTSFDSLFLPTCFLAFDRKLQYRRKPARCQRRTVSGWTSMRDCFHTE